MYDPLVDWAVGEECSIGGNLIGGGGAGGCVGGGVGAAGGGPIGGVTATAGALAVSVYGGDALGTELCQARQLLEHEVNRDTMALRFTELRPEWMKNG